jgi:hypothetical protein
MLETREANGCTRLLLPRQEPRQSHIGKYGVKPNISLAGICIRYLAPANSKCQTNAGREEVLNTRPCLENKVDRVLCSWIWGARLVQDIPAVSSQSVRMR